MGRGGAVRLQPDRRTFSLPGGPRFSCDISVVVVGMERRASITSLSSNLTAKLAPSVKVSSLSPLINLERFVYRLASLMKDNSGLVQLEKVRSKQAWEGAIFAVLALFVVLALCVFFIATQQTAANNQ